MSGQDNPPLVAKINMRRKLPKSSSEMTKYHFADRWQPRPLVWTDDQKQPQCLDSKNANVVLRLPFSPNLVPRDYASEDEIATARA